MNESAGEQVQRPDSKRMLTPIGDRLLGTRDPRTLSPQEFQQSPDILFHGSAVMNRFDPAFDYSSPFYQEVSEGSQTLGVGFYTTDSRAAAENYAKERRHGSEPPIVTPLLPYRARMLDFRAAQDPETNAIVPDEFILRWREYFGKTRAGMSEESHWLIQNIFADYDSYLGSVIKTATPVTLRQLLDTAPTLEQLGGHNSPHPPYMSIFSEFMQSQNYDGLIYIEGGEGLQRTNHASYVFFNLDKIGSFESWKSDSPQT